MCTLPEQRPLHARRSIPRWKDPLQRNHEVEDYEGRNRLYLCLELDGGLNRRHGRTGYLRRLLRDEFHASVACERARGEPRTLSDMHRNAPLHVRQGKGGPPVAAEIRSEKRKERLVLIDRQDLSIGQGPAAGGKTPSHYSDLGKKWI